MYAELRRRERSGERLRIALIGAGSMGLGLAWQIRHTPGMELVSITDIDLEAAVRAAEAYGGEYRLVDDARSLPGPSYLIVSRTPFFLFDWNDDLAIDVLVEATPTIGFAAEACLAAIQSGIHVVLMNAEVDLALGPLLRHEAVERGVVVSSDAGDQHGVLARMIDEIRMWGFRIVMAGNIKGFLDRYATAESLAHEARIRNLNPIQCCGYTDGTKLAIEMALIGNSENLIPWKTGMEGPRARHVQEVFDLFDFDKYGDRGVVDYILGAEPGGGVFVVGHCEDPLQRTYLKYYKLGDGPYYLFYRPYHLCHLETPRAIALAGLFGRAFMEPRYGRIADVYAYAKRPLKEGEPIPHAIGGEHCYGLIDSTANADPPGGIPIAMLEAQAGQSPTVRRSLERDEPIHMDDVDVPPGDLSSMFRRQGEILARRAAGTDERTDKEA